MIRGATGLIFPKTRAEDVGLWLAVVLEIIVLGLMIAHSSGETFQWMIIGVLAGVLLVTLALILLRGVRLRQRSRAIVAKVGAPVSLKFLDAQEIALGPKYFPSVGEGCLTVDSDGLKVWVLEPTSWPNRDSLLVFETRDVRMIRSERVLRLVCFPDLIIELTDGRCYRFIPTKQSGVPWRAGCSGREMHALLEQLAQIVGPERVALAGDERFIPYGE